MEAYPESEKIGTLFRLSERCRLGVVEAWIEACVAAADLCGGEYADVEADWLRAWRDLEDRKHELRVDWLGPLRDQPSEAGDAREQDERVRSALAEFYESVDHALRRWERWAADEEDRPVTTATKAKRGRRRDVKVGTRCSVRRDAHGQTKWTCPECHTEHYDSVKACGCGGYVAPTHRLPEMLQAQIDAGPIMHQHGHWTCPACLHAGNHIPDTTCVECRWDAREAFEKRFAEGWGRLTGTELAEVPATQDEAAAKETAVDFPRETIDVPLELVDENPLNTRRNWGDLEVMAATFQTVGQLQECIGRRKGDRVELVAGGRRYRAAKLAGVPTLRVRIVDCDDLLALDMMGEENEQQQTWDAISRAAWLQAELDARQWSTRQLAAHLGVSQADVANHTRLLKLPDDWQQKVITQEITPSMARSLATWAERPAVLQEMAKRLPREKPETVDEFERLLADVLHSLTRPCTPGEYFSVQDGKRHRSGEVRLMKKDIEHAELDIVEAPPRHHFRGGSRKKVPVAFNTRLWDELQAQREQEHEARSARATAGKGKSKGQASAKGAGPKRTAADERHLREQQARQLAAKVWRYKVRWLQARAAEMVRTAEGHVGIKLLLAFAGTDDHDGRRRKTLAEVVRAGGSGKAKHRDYAGVDAWQTVASIATGPEVVDLARQVLSAWLALDVFAGWHAPLHPSDVLVAAAELGVDLEREWRVDQAFLELFTKDQLVDLAREWKLDVNESAIAAGKRAAFIDQILERDQSKRLPVPKVLKAVRL